MKDSSDADTLHSQVIFLKMREKSTEELISIWIENNQKARSKEEFGAVQRVLLERLGKLPQQKVTQEVEVTSVRKKGIHAEPTRISFRDLSPYTQIQVIIGVICITGLCFGSIVVTMVEQNTKLFWEFAKSVTSSDIEKIELQRIDQRGNGIGEVITVTDSKVISEFVSLLNGIQQHDPNYPRAQKKIRIKLWRTKERTIEFQGYTLPGSGRAISVGNLWIRPGIYPFGNGKVEFPASGLYDWLARNGIEIEE
jgi:hypothetical protein